MKDPLAASSATPASPETEPLQHARLPFDLLFDAMPDAVLLVDPLGQILHVNEQAVALFGYSRDELVGQPVELLVPHRYRDSHPRHRAAWLLKPAPRSMNARPGLTGLRKDGAEIPVDIAIKPCRAKGQLYVLAVVRDVRERRLLEDQLRNFQQAQSLSRFAGSAAHDFQNHLAVIAAMGQLLKDELPGDSAAQKVVDDLLQAVDRASRSTREILLQSQSENLQPGSIDLNEFLKHMRGVLNHVVGEHVDLVLRPAPVPCTVLVDAARFEQMILNLATNARDAMPNGGCLTISIAQARPEDCEEILDSGRGTTYAKISVADTGSGMDPQTRLRIFEPFFSTKAPGSGTGLGLAIVHGIVKQYSGCITVHSQPGRGSVFNVFLPLHAPQQDCAGPLGAASDENCPAA